MCRVSSCVVGRGYLLWPMCSPGKTVSLCLCPAWFCCTPRPNLPVTPGISWLPTFAFQSPMMKRWRRQWHPTPVLLPGKIPWTEEPGRLQSMGSQRVGHDWATSFHFSLSCIGEGNGNPLQCSCLENPRDGGAWWAAVYGVAQSQTRLKQLSSSMMKSTSFFDVSSWRSHRSS